MKFAATWVAADLARATGRDRDFPPNTVEMVGVPGPWGRTCEAIGWVEAIRRCALADQVDVMFREAQRDAATESRAMVRRFATATAPEPELTLLDGAGVRHSGTGSIVRTPPHIFIADDVSTSQGWVLDPDFVRAHLVPLYGKLVTEVRKSADKAGLDPASLVVGFHSDGDISDIYPDLAAVGFNAVHLASVSYVSVSRLAATAKASGMVAYGGVATETLSEGGLADDLCRMLARTARADGLVVADDGGVTDAAELDALTAAYVKVGLY